MTPSNPVPATPRLVPALTAGKVQPHHLDRLAVVYVRQSTPKQVLENRESTDRQYALADRAVALGWTRDRVITIDDDLGQSGRTAADRAGFQRLLAEVGLNHVGLILGSETSRLARSCKDWSQLPELAAVFGVLIADYDGLYDPGQHADRMMLGLSGMMSEAELHVMRNRLDQGKRNKAARGELLALAPIGYVRGPSGEMALDPDEQVQGVIRRIFETFAARGSVRQVLVQLIRDGVRLAACARCGWRMHVLYRGRPQAPRYVCHRNNPPRPDRPRCPSVSARTIDAVVSQQLLAALAPAALELSLTAAEGLQREAEQRDRQWQLQLERVRYQTERARRRFDAAEPENRLVARELERRWEEALRAERGVQEEFARSRLGSTRELTEPDRACIAALATDIPALWATAVAAERQAILRHLVERVEIEATEHSEATRLSIHWVGGGISRHALVRPVSTYERLGDLPRLRERIRELLAAGRRSGQIAAQLSAEGFRSPKGDQRFTADRIRQIVCRLGLRPRRSSLTADAPRLGCHEAWMTDLAEELAIPIPTLMAWCKRGWVEAREVEAAVLRWVVWADAAEKARLKRLAGGRASGLHYPYPPELTTPKRRRDRQDGRK